MYDLGRLRPRNSDGPWLLNSLCLSCPQGPPDSVPPFMVEQDWLPEAQRINGISVPVLSRYRTYSSPKNCTRNFSSSALHTRSLAPSHSLTQPKPTTTPSHPNSNKSGGKNGRKQLTLDPVREKTPQDAHIDYQTDRIPQHELRAEPPPEEAEVRGVAR